MMAAVGFANTHLAPRMRGELRIRRVPAANKGASAMLWDRRYVPLSWRSLFFCWCRRAAAAGRSIPSHGRARPLVVSDCVPQTRHGGGGGLVAGQGRCQALPGQPSRGREGGHRTGRAGLGRQGAARGPEGATRPRSELGPYGPRGSEGTTGRVGRGVAAGGLAHSFHRVGERWTSAREPPPAGEKERDSALGCAGRGCDAGWALVHVGPL